MKATPNLTRSVFRAILGNRPYVVEGCRVKLAKHHAPVNRSRHLSPVQSRQLFGLSWGKTARGLQGAKSTPSNLEKALTALADFVKARHTQSRLPPGEEVVAALRLVFAAHAESKKEFTRNETPLVSAAFSYLTGQASEENAVLSQDDREFFLTAMSDCLREAKYRTDLTALVNTIYRNLRQVYPRHSSDATLSYITVLSKTGAAREALEVLREARLPPTERNLSPYLSAFEGLYKEGSHDILRLALADFREMFESEPSSRHHMNEGLASFFARRDWMEDVISTQKEGLAELASITTSCLIDLVDCGARNGAFDWSQPLVNELKQRSDDESIAATVLKWVSARYQNTADVMAALEEMLESNETLRPEISTFNSLIEFAHSKKNPKLANEYLSLADSFNLRPNAKTYALQLQDALARKDYDEAQHYFEAMAVEDPPRDGSAERILNKFIASLAFAPGNHFEHIMRAVDTLVDRGAELDAEAISGLCQLYLHREELEELTGVLRYRVNTLPIDERARIGAVFREFIIDPMIKDQRAYNAYELFRQAFPETPVEQRLPIMRSFFDRKRPDLACLVFGHMRQREDPAARPKAEAYAECFSGIAKCKDIDGLQMVYNMLKLDLEVEPTTRVRNGLMAAYTACQLPFTAIIDHFWKILDSREGPTMSTFMLALRACEIWIPQGAQEARRIIALLQTWQFSIDKSLYDCYIGALAGQSEFENVVELIENMENDVGEKPDAFTIGTFYNAIPWQYRKDEVEKWAKASYPELWEELAGFGDEVDEEWEVRYFKIDRTVDLDDGLLFDADEYDPQVARQMHAALEVPSK